MIDWQDYNNTVPAELELETFNLLTAEQVRLIRFDNWLIIDCFQMTLNGNFLLADVLTKVAALNYSWTTNYPYLKPSLFSYLLNNDSRVRWKSMYWIKAKDFTLHSQWEGFSIWSFLNMGFSQSGRFSNGAILNWSDLGSPSYAIFQYPGNREI